MGSSAPLELLYRLTQRDLAFPHWGPNYGNLTRVAGESTLETNLAGWDAGFEAPQGTILFVTNLIAQANPGGAQTINRLEVRILNRRTDNLVALVLADRFTATTDTTVRSSTFDFCLLPDRDYLAVIGTFNSGASSNVVELSWLGYLVPRGEIGFI